MRRLGGEILGLQGIWSEIPSGMLLVSRQDPSSAIVAIRSAGKSATKEDRPLLSLVTSNSGSSVLHDNSASKIRADEATGCLRLQPEPTQPKGTGRVTRRHFLNHVAKITEWAERYTPAHSCILVS